MNWLARNWYIAVVTVGALTAQPILAQSKTTDLAERARQQRAQAEAAAEATVQEAILNATTTAKTSPVAAIRELNLALAKLNTTLDISVAKQDALSTKIQQAIAKLRKGDTGPGNTIDPRTAERLKKDNLARDAAAIEAKAVNDGLSAMSKDLEAGQEREAKLKLSQLLAKYPDNAALLRMAGSTRLNDSIQDAKEIARLSADGFRTAMNSVQESTIPTAQDISFPKDWKEKMERRRLLNAPKFTEEERKLLQALETPIKTALTNAPFEEAMQTMSTLIDQKLHVDKKALEEASIDLSSPVNVPSGVSAKTALRLMLQQQGLTFVISENIIQVVTIDQAKKFSVTRAYDVRDIVMGGGAFNTLTLYGPYIDAQQTAVNAQLLIQSIQKTIDPSVWKDASGGPATVTFNFATMSLIVRAPSEVHAELYDKMYPPIR